jgi:hypothetical protein
MPFAIILRVPSAGAVRRAYLLHTRPKHTTNPPARDPRTTSTVHILHRSSAPPAPGPHRAHQWRRGTFPVHQISVDHLASTDLANGVTTAELPRRAESRSQELQKDETGADYRWDWGSARESTSALAWHSPLAALAVGDLVLLRGETPCDMRGTSAGWLEAEEATRMKIPALKIVVRSLLAISCI